MRNIHRVGLMAAALLASAGVSAYESGDWIVRGGAVMVAPNDDSSKLDLAGIKFPEVIDFCIHKVEKRS